ncbi:MAG: hypothetical protein F4Z57_07840 [Gemmatimonadetes bacterium]|nr:hypothetical protein [Gemmatimonadota bacterium]
MIIPKIPSYLGEVSDSVSSSRCRQDVLKFPMSFITLLIFVLSVISCSQEHSTTSAADQSSSWQQIEIDGVPYRQVVAKANAVAADISLDLTYEVINGEAYISVVKIDGVEYRADCSDTGRLDGENPSIPHHEFCEDGVDERDIDFTCGGLRNPPSAPSAADIRLKVDGNENYLLDRFKDAFEIEVREIVPGRGYTEDEIPISHRTTFNLSDVGADFFRFEIDRRRHYIVRSSGETDTWGDLYKLEGDRIRAIAGTGMWADRGNFAIQMDLDPGEYYLRVSPEGRGDTGSYTVQVSTFVE